MASIETASDENGKYYELHITFAAGWNKVSLSRHKQIIEDAGWSFSSITDDPELGPGTKYYATTRLNPKRWSELSVLKFLKETRYDFEKLNLDPVRDKIELVIHDSRTTKIRIDENPVVPII